MKNFEAPEMEILRFSVEDIITSSRDDEMGDDYWNGVYSIDGRSFPITGV